MADNIYGITIGDPSGVGPEILLKAEQAGEIREKYVAYGDLAVLQFYQDKLGYNVKLHRISKPSEHAPGCLNVIDHGLLTGADIKPGQLDRQAGAAAREYVISATKAALRGEIAAMVTLPMNKEATQLSDPHFTGHTELIGEVCCVDDVTIMLVSNQLVVTHVSTHVSLLTAIARAKKQRILTI